MKFCRRRQEGGCPSFRDVRKLGTTDPDLMFIRHSQTPAFYATPEACRPGSIVTMARVTPLYYHQLLSAPAAAGQPTKSRPVSAGSGKSTAALSFRSPGIRGHAEKPVERGRIWQPRFYDFVVFSDKKRVQKLRYMPVKRGLVLEPGQGRWSSSRHYAHDESGLVLVNQPQPAELIVRKIS